MAKDTKKKKIKVPKSVLDLKWSPKKFAKKHSIRISGKGMSKHEKKRATKRLNHEYIQFVANGLNKAVKILSENQMEESKKIVKVKDAVEKIILNSEVMKKVAKKYSKDKTAYPNLIYLPNMIDNTILFYSREDMTEEEKAYSETLDRTALVEFCEKILRKQIKAYESKGLSAGVSYQMASVIPTAKILKNNRKWYRRLIQTLYTIAEHEKDIDVQLILTAIRKIDKKKILGKKEFYLGFFSEFILTKDSNKKHNFTDEQKELNETLIEQCLEYLNTRKSRVLKDILKTYIKRRKKAEEYNNDNRRIIKFIDFANSNSEHTNLKAAVQELISDNSNNELYLS